MEKILLNDGQEYAVRVCGAQGGNLYITLAQPMTVQDAARVFGDPDITGKITLYEGEKEKATFAGYTGLFGIMIEQYTKATQIYLKQEAANNGTV